MLNYRVLSKACRQTLLPHTLILSLLGACSHLPPKSPEPDPVALTCRKPEVRANLMIPPTHQAIDRLLISLGMSPVQLPSVATPSSDSRLSNFP